jgi:hypothetical protein
MEVPNHERQLAEALTDISGGSPATESLELLRQWRESIPADTSSSSGGMVANCNVTEEK